MTINGFDELNTPKVQVEEPEEYFKKMDISPKQRKERVETSKELADVMLFLFALMAIEMQANKPNYPSVLRPFKQRFRDVVSKHSRTDEYVENYINEFTGNVFDTTRRYMEAAGVGVDGRTDAGWWTSVDRATVIGENEANSILNYEELKQAEEEGYTKKTWITERDNRVRPTHKEVDGVTIGISEYFIVGGGMMLAPHDWYNNPAECPNCRCSLQYKGKRIRSATNVNDIIDDIKMVLSNNRGQVELPGRYTDVTQEWFDNATPNSHKIQYDNEFVDKGKVYTVDGKHVRHNNTPREIEVAHILEDKLGGEIRLVPEVKIPQKVSTPDYIFRGRRLDLKEITGSGRDCVRDAVKNKKEQASDFVIDITKAKLPDEELMKQIEGLFERFNTMFVDIVIVIKEKDILRILRRG